MNISDIKKFDFINGEGIRVSIFVSGCNHYCKNCFNTKTWNENFGEEFTDEIQELLFEHIEDNFFVISGISILGGDPTYSTNIQPLIDFTNRFKIRFPTKTIWIWSGYTYEEISKDKKMFELINNCNVLVDGKFKEELKNLDLKFRGSENQRVIDVQKSLTNNKIELYLE